MAEIVANWPRKTRELHNHHMDSTVWNDFAFRDGDVIVSHVANILLYLSPKLGLAPRPKALVPFAHGLQLTITDFVAEIHDTHHPISGELYYEDQKKEAKARATACPSGWRKSTHTDCLLRDWASHHTEVPSCSMRHLRKGSPWPGGSILMI